MKQSDWFSNASVVAAGDFNRNVQWDANRPGRNHTEVVRLFESHGLINAYPAHHDEKQEPNPPAYCFYAIRTSHSTSSTCSSRRIAG